MKKNTNVKIVIGLIGVVILLYAGCTIWANSDSNEKNRRAYERGYNHPSIVGADLALIDAGARINCHSIGLDGNGCPQSDGDTTRRVMATLMTQTMESEGPGRQGNAYMSDTIKAMNHRFYDLIHHLQENPCGPIRYGYANDQILEQLRQGGFIYRCGQGWSITAEWLEHLNRLELLSPNTPRGHDPQATSVDQGTVVRLDQEEETTNVESATQRQEATEQGDCDQLLKSQLVFQKRVSTANQIQDIIIQIQTQKDDCISEIWNPVVNDNNRTGTNGCWESEAATERMSSPTVGDLGVPYGLFDSRDTASSVVPRSGRDSENNIIVYWGDIPRRNPADGAVCWMYVSRMNSWSKGIATSTATSTATSPSQNCDDILRNQFIFQRNASTVSSLNAVIANLQNQRVDQCSVDVWDPEVATEDLVTAGTDGCKSSDIGGRDVPTGLHKGGTSDPTHARYRSGRDRDNNIIIHWKYSNRPVDDANCWLYVERLSAWSTE